MKLFDPTDGPRAAGLRLATRRPALAGLRVALVDNTSEIADRADALCDAVAALLVTRR